MSEKMYAYLLRLLPPAFRRRYEEEALLLVRDRLRDERGFPNRLRLILDLITDTIGALPQAYRNTYAEVATATSVASNFDQVPSFRVLQQEPIRRGAIATAGVLSVTALLTLMFVLGHPIPYRPAAPNSPDSPIESVIARLNQPISPNSLVNLRSDAPGPASANRSSSDAQTLSTTKAELSSGNKVPASAFHQPTQPSQPKPAITALDQPGQSSQPNPSTRDANQRSSVTVAAPSSPAQSQSPIRITQNLASSNVQALSPATEARNTSERWTASFRAVGTDTDVPQWFVLKQDGLNLTGSGGLTPTEQSPIIHGQVANGSVTFELQEEKKRYFYHLKFKGKNLRGILSIKSAIGIRPTQMRLDRIR